MKTLKIALVPIILFVFYLQNVTAQQTMLKTTFAPVNVSASFDSAKFFKTFKSAYTTVNGIKLHYVIGGRGKQVVVLVHGFPADWYSWRKIMPLLVQQYTVIAPDLRGLGKSDKPATGYSKKNMAKDVHELVHVLGYKNIYIVGYDFGGPVSFAYTCEFPEDVKKLVLFECGGVAGFGLEKLMDITHGGFWHFGFFMTPKIPEMLIKGREREFFSAFSYGGIIKEKSAFTSADINHYLNNLAAQGGLNGAFEYYRSYPQDVKDNKVFAMHKITIPILAMDGLLAGQTKIEIKKLALNVSGTAIPNGGHWLAEERPNDILMQIIPFFNKK